MDGLDDEEDQKKSQEQIVEKKEEPKEVETAVVPETKQVTEKQAKPESPVAAKEPSVHSQVIHEESKPSGQSSQKDVEMNNHASANMNSKNQVHVKQQAVDQID